MTDIRLGSFSRSLNSYEVSKTGLEIFHNYVRPNEGLDGRTPSKLVGITVEGEDKWLTLIQNSAQRPTKIDRHKEPTAT